MRYVRFALLGLAAVLVMALAAAVQVALAATPTDVFFSEYIEGSSNNKALEIYNGTGADIDLAAGNYVIEMSFNGGTGTGSIALTGVVADGDVYVVADNDADAAILAEADQTPTSSFFNGDDAIILWSGGVGGTVVDSIGQLGIDPGSEWSGGGIGTQNETLRRLSTVCTGDTTPDDAFDPSAEWEGFAEDTFDGLGSHTVNCDSEPTPEPTEEPTPEPTEEPTPEPTEEPTPEPTEEPTPEPTEEPTPEPTEEPTPEPTEEPTPEPTPEPVVVGLVINEIDYDQVDSDAAEFVEIKNVSAEAIDLSAYNLLLVNGNGAAVYNTIALPAVSLAAGDYFVVCANAATVDNCDLDASPDTNFIQNGAPDAVAIAAVADGALVDVVSYEGDTAAPYTEGVGTSAADSNSVGYVGLSRYPDGTDTDNNDADLSLRCITPGEANSGSTSSCEPVPPATPAFIHDIQSAGATVSGPGPFLVEGIVVGDLQENSPPEFDGFFLQEEDADADTDDATSEGIFVYCGNTCPTDVSVGDLVQVTGGASDYNGLSELSAFGATDVVVLSSGNPLPTAATLTFPVPAAVGGVDYLERYEGMRVTMPGPMTITEYYNLDRYGEFLVTAGGRVYQYTQVNLPDAAGYQAFLEDFALRTITIDDGYNYQNPDPLVYPPPEFSATNSFRGGDTVTDVDGVLHYAFGLWRIQPADPPTVDATFNAENPRPASAPAVGGDLKVASFNVLNYFNGDGQGGGFPTSRGAYNLEEFERQRAKIIAAMSQMDADIIGLMELENDYGDGADSAVADLVNGLNAAGTTCSNWAYVDPGVAQLGSDEIAVGFVYCTDTVEIAPGTSPAYLNTPDVFDGINTSRTPLAVTFAQKSTGAEVTVVVNHLKSKGDSGLADDPTCQSTPEANLDCDQGDGQGYWNYRRTQGAEMLLSWLAVKPTGTMDSDVLLIGDMNAYALEDPVQTFLAAGYENMVTTFQGSDAYSYVFSGQWGSLDHVLASSTLAAQVVGAEDWHINSDEPDALDYNTDYRSANQVANWYLPNAFRSSDHDPVLIGLELNAAPVCGSAYPSDDTLWPADGRFDRVTVRGVTDPDGDRVWITIDSIFQDEPVVEWHDGWSGRRDRHWLGRYGWYSGTAPDGKGVGTSTAWLRAERDMPGNGRVYHVYFTASDGNGGACSGEVTVGVPRHRGWNGAAVDDGPLYDSTVIWPWWW